MLEGKVARAHLGPVALLLKLAEELHERGGGGVARRRGAARELRKHDRQQRVVHGVRRHHVCERRQRREEPLREAPAPPRARLGAQRAVAELLCVVRLEVEAREAHRHVGQQLAEERGRGVVEELEEGLYQGGAALFRGHHEAELIELRRGRLAHLFLHIYAS